MKSALKALERLREGNERFLSGTPRIGNRTNDARIGDLVSSTPFAIVLGCADARVPAEIVFDQGLGDLFVVRVAANVLAPSIVGSIELATDLFGCPLVLILGHSRCGAVQATVDHLDSPAVAISPNLNAIVKRIRPIAETVRRDEPSRDRDTIVEQVVRENINASVDGLCAMSTALSRRVQEEKLLVVGAKYALETGVVEFFRDGDSQ